MSAWLALPISLPLGTAILALLLPARRLQRIVNLVGTGALLIVALTILAQVRRGGPLVLAFGGWPAPFGIVFVADLFSAIMVVLTGIIGVATASYSLATIDAQRERFGYVPLFQILLMGVCGAFLTGDLFNLYVWFEVLLIASFVLLTLGGERGQLEGGIKYVTLNLLSSALFLAAAGMIYAEAGTLNLAQLHTRLHLFQPGLVTALAMLLLVAFGIKAALFPLFFWLPASYHTPPVATAALFAGLLTKVGVYALIRVFTLLFMANGGAMHTLLLALAGLTMLSGVLGALVQHDLRRVLAFLLVSHMGYMVMGLGLFTPLALAGTILYLMHHMLVKTSLFLLSGMVQRLSGSYDLRRSGGLYARYPAIALLFLLAALALVGIPPLSGFLAKLALVRAGLEAEHYIIVAIALLVSLLTLLALAHVWHTIFWKAAPADAPALPEGGLNALSIHLGMMVVPTAALLALVVLIGVLAGPLSELAYAAAEQLNPSIYTTVVLGGAP